MHEGNTTEALTRAVMKGIISFFMMTVFVEGNETWTVYPNDGDPVEYGPEGIQDYCAALVESGV